MNRKFGSTRLVAALTCLTTMALFWGPLAGVSAAKPKVRPKAKPTKAAKVGLKLKVSPTAISMSEGNIVPVVATLTRQGFSGAIELRAASKDRMLTLSVDENPVMGDTAHITVSVPAGTAPGNASLVVTALAGQTVASATITVVVTPAPKASGDKIPVAGSGQTGTGQPGTGQSVAVVSPGAGALLVGPAPVGQTGVALPVGTSAGTTAPSTTLDPSTSLTTVTPSTFATSVTLAVVASIPGGTAPTGPSSSLASLVTQPTTTTPTSTPTSTATSTATTASTAPPVTTSPASGTTISPATTTSVPPITSSTQAPTTNAPTTQGPTTTAAFDPSALPAGSTRLLSPTIGCVSANAPGGGTLFFEMCNVNDIDMWWIVTFSSDNKTFSLQSADPRWSGYCLDGGLGTFVSVGASASMVSGCSRTGQKWSKPQAAGIKPPIGVFILTNGSLPASYCLTANSNYTPGGTRFTGSPYMDPCYDPGTTADLRQVWQFV